MRKILTLIGQSVRLPDDQLARVNSSNSFESKIFVIASIVSFETKKSLYCCLIVLLADLFDLNKLFIQHDQNHLF